MPKVKSQPDKGIKPPPRNTRPEKAVSLHPLEFEEALTHILSVPPEPKGKGGDWQKAVSTRKKR